MTTKKLHIRTYGCQMNVYDSSRMADVLAPLGYEPCDAPEDADMIILNTCHIREKAAEKVFSELGRLRHLKDRKAAKGERLVLAVGGCVAQAQGDEILARQPAVDMVFGPQTYHQLPDMLQRVLGASEKTAEKPVATDFDSLAKFDALPEESRSQGVTAFLTIQEGCDKFCTFCVVPYTRGAEVSRPVADILREAEKLAAQGSRDITLLGQNVNAYHGDDGAGGTIGLGQLLRLLAGKPGVERLRYTTSHPRDVDDDLIAAHALPQVMPFLHLPVQSGSDRILQDMNRKHTAADYLDIVRRLRSARPDLALSSDFIVGFPGETDADFDATLKLVEQVTFAQAYSFKYSPRPGTPASERADQVAEDVKSRRLAVLQDVLTAQQTRYNQDCLGKTLPVLFEKPGRHNGQLVGRSPYMQAVSVTLSPPLMPDDLLGTLANVMITNVLPNSLAGQLTEI